MSIPLRDGFIDETLERCLEDLLVRFVVNCPEEDLSSIERVLFQIEEAHWFYQDFLRTLNPLLPSMKMKQFTNKLVEQCPLIWKWGDPSEALAQFGKYKSTIPVRGCALLNTSMDKVLLVKGIESSSWGFPRGKISKGESDLNCALRELDEETGFDASDLIEEDEFVERTIKGKNYKIYIVKGVPDDTKFVPKVRYEIADIQWMDIKYLTKATKTTSNFYLVGSMLKSIVSYIKRMKNNESEEELKRLATVQLKKILGIDKTSVEKEENAPVDPGRELLSMLRSAAQSSQLAGEEQTQPAPEQLPQQQQPQQPQQQFPLLYQAPFMQHQQFNLPFLSPNHMAFQQNRMVPVPSHNPFALQMFNPYLPLPAAVAPNSLSFSSPMVNNQFPQQLPLHLTSQGMSPAPSASTFSKPQFSLANKKQTHENSKELLDILKSKTQQKETSSSSSAELLNVLKNDTVANKQSKAPSISRGPIKLLKRESPIIQDSDKSENRRNNGTSSISAVKNSNDIKADNKPFDITEPANKSTSRNISKTVPNSKTVVLLKKSSRDNSNVSILNTGTANNLPVSSKDDEHVNPISVADEKPARLVESITNSTKRSIPVGSLNLLTSPNNNSKGDPSAQLLDILQKHNSSAESTAAVNTPPTDPSKSLLNILKNPVKNTSSSSDASKNLLSVLKKKDEIPSKDQSINLLNVLKGKDNLQSSEKSSEKSAELLGILKAKDTSISSNTSSAMSDISKKPESPNQFTQTTPSSSSPVVASADRSAELLNILHGIKSPVPSANTCTSTTTFPTIGTPSQSTALLNILKGKSNTNSVVSSPSEMSSSLFQTMNNEPNSSNNSHPYFQQEQQPDLHQQQFPGTFMQQGSPVENLSNQSADILALLKGGSNNSSSPQMQIPASASALAPSVPSTVSTQSMQLPMSQLGQHFMQPEVANGGSSNSNSAAILDILRGGTVHAPSIGSNNSSQINVPMSEFKDFDDLDDGEIEGEYVINNGLYSDD